MDGHNGDCDDLPPPPPLPPDFKPEVGTESMTELPKKAEKPKRVPMQRTGLAKKGQPIQLVSNHFRVSFRSTEDFFYHYSVVLKYDDEKPVESKGVGRKVIDKLKQTYGSDIGYRDFAYDGEKTLFTLGPLPQVNNVFTVVAEDSYAAKNLDPGSPTNHNGDNENGSTEGGDRKRSKRSYHQKTYIVEITFAAKIPVAAINQAMRGQESENSQEALRVLDIILRQHAAKQGCLLVRQNFFHNNPENLVGIGGGVMGCRGFHSSFRGTQSGLSLNIDVTTTMVVKPGPVIDFLLENQKVNNADQIDWNKAKKTLKNLRITTHPTNFEFKIAGLSDLSCRNQTFFLKRRDGDPVEITVYDYFDRRGFRPTFSADYPCINTGKPKRPTYIPIEFCSLIPLQRYTKALTGLQRASLVEKSRQKPRERMTVLEDALRRNDYGSDSMLRACGISIAPTFTQVDGRVLQPPKLKAGNGEDFFARNGRWNFNNKQFIRPCCVDKWAVVNFSARCDVRGLVRDLTRCANTKGINMSHPFDAFEESLQTRRLSPTARVDEMFDRIKSNLPGPPNFLLCLLPDRKNSEIYGPWKKKCLAEFGIVTQCLAPIRVNDQYLTNLLLKINAKLDGMNSLLHVENMPALPVVSKSPTIIMGMDVSHGSPGRSDIPSIAAVVGSRQWPLISKYRASVRSQSPRLEMIESLYKPTGIGTDDDGIIRELLVDFYSTSGKQKPANVIIFRDGVSESQFNQVLNVELDQIIQACKLLDETWNPKFTLIIAQKNHHTKFFQLNSPDNVPPGTVVDNKVCHPRNYDFYMCSHAGMIGTTRPTHYHVLLDEIGFSPDDLQELVHSLSYVYQRSTTAISVVAPVCYAHLAAAQVSSFVKFEELSDGSTSHGLNAGGNTAVPQLPRLHGKVESSMFFC